MNKYLCGAIAGAAATVPMTLTMLWLNRKIPLHIREPLPPKQITVKVFKELGLEEAVDERTERDIVSLVNHFAYGTATGAIYAPLASAIDAPPVVKGVTFGLAVWALSYLGWLPALGILPSATEERGERNAVMIAAHVVWGGVLGIALSRIECVVLRETRRVPAFSSHCLLAPYPGF